MTIYGAVRTHRRPPRNAIGTLMLTASTLIIAVAALVYRRSARKTGDTSNALTPSASALKTLLRLPIVGYARGSARRSQLDRHGVRDRAGIGRHQWGRLPHGHGGGDVARAARLRPRPTRFEPAPTSARPGA